MDPQGGNSGSIGRKRRLLTGGKLKRSFRLGLDLKTFEKTRQDWKGYSALKKGETEKKEGGFGV